MPPIAIESTAIHGRAFQTADAMNPVNASAKSSEFERRAGPHGAIKSRAENADYGSVRAMHGGLSHPALL
ncbi:hypothetical protein GA0061102_10587 [Rhizobium miluonense]|uniref:Uncharacterized protein n=1 Tax=Rhizobium miluonense TaxID=411945 RepID=A0A1C3X4Y4_9HYPH|nr:hypothetical protein GA0061102_10587 [Rhizobium miluonense]